MGVLDRFLNAMKLNDDEDLDGEGFLDDDYEDDYEEERPEKKRLISSRYEDDEDEDLEPARPAAPVKAPAERPAPKARPKVVKNNSTSAKISPMRPRQGGGMEVCVIKPRSMDDSREITDTLLEGCTVVLNMEGIDMDLAQRIIDFSSGSCYALHGKLQRSSTYIFIITPQSVDISGDFQEVLNGAIGMQSFDSPRY